MYCKLPTNGKQLPAFPLKAITGIEPRPQRWEARVLPLCHRGPSLVKENMVEYLTELLQDACDYSWEAAKGAHSVLLHRMQDGVVAWDNLKDVNKIRKRYAHTASSQYGAGSERSRVTKVVPYFKYNKGSCTRGTDHKWQNMLLKHICQHCFSTFNKYEAHAKKDCLKAQKTRFSCSWLFCK